MGERGRITPEDITCGYGRTLPALAGIEGRTNDLLMTREGRQVYVTLASIFYGLPVGEGQVIQETLEQVRILYVPLSAFTLEAERVMVERLRACVGAIEVALEQADQVPRSANGKFRAANCD
jgi:phenylacetate-CoA ligase